MSVCLASWAILARLDADEPAAGEVQRAFETERPWMSWLNVGEVAYQLERRHDPAESELAVDASAPPWRSTRSRRGAS